MKHILFVLLHFLFLTCSAQSKNYNLVYKLNSTNEVQDGKSAVEDYFLDNITYSVYANDKVCYIDSAEVLDADGFTANMTGESNLYINYIENFSFFNFNSGNVNKFSTLKFTKIEGQDNLKLLNFKLNKYISEDKKIILYTTTDLPWFIQPCIFDKNIINEGIVKLVNKKSNYELELIRIEDVKKEKIIEIQNKILGKKQDKIITIPSPFLQ